MSSVCNAECLANIAWAFVAADRQLSPQERERESNGFPLGGFHFLDSLGVYPMRWVVLLAPLPRIPSFGVVGLILGYLTAYLGTATRLRVHNVM